MKRRIWLLPLFITIFFNVFLGFIPTFAAESAPFSLSAQTYALLDGQSRTVLCARGERVRLPMASTTKIMTALVALQELPLDTVISIPKEAVGIEGSSVYLCEGDRYTLEELLYALLLQSANDAAAAIALAVGGSLPRFAELMNEKADELGLTDTHFVTPHGLDDPQHYTTAEDLGLVACEALSDPTFAKIVATRRHTFQTVEGEKARVLLNHNKLLVFYEGTVGVKTGFTKKSGRCLVSAARRDGLLLVAVTLNAPSDWSDHTLLFNYGFENYESRLLAAPNEFSYTLPLFNVDQTVEVSNPDEIRVTLRKGEPAPTPRFHLYPRPVAPVTAENTAGYVLYSYQGKTLSFPLTFRESVSLPKIKKGWFDIFRKKV